MNNVSGKSPVEAIRAVRGTITENNLIEKNGHVIVGLSGGPDSLCLFHILLSFREEMKFQMSAVHLNHKFRKGDAEEDQKFVENFCKDKGIPCYSKTVDVLDVALKNGDTPEEAGRNERYKAYDEEAGRVLKTGIPKEKISIAVAQNRNDQVETILMRILRGTGPDGLSGIPYTRKSENGFKIIRPLLDTDRKDIEECCSIFHLDPRIDHTNSETGYNRNRIRLDLLPKLKEDYNVGAENSLIRLSALASTDKEYFDNLTEEFINEHCEFQSGISARVNVDGLNDLHTAISRRVIMSIFKKIGFLQDMEAVHMDAAMNLIKKNETGKIAEFPGGFRIRISYGQAFIYHESDGQFHSGNSLKGSDSAEISIGKDDITGFDVSGTKVLEFPGGSLKIEKARPEVDFSLDDLKNKFILALDPDMLIKIMKDTEGDMVIRYREPGDRIFLKGIGGSKKIQDLFIDEKVPRDERNRIPVIAVGHEILWVIGIRKSDHCTWSNNVKECLLLEWKQND